MQPSEKAVHRELARREKQMKKVVLTVAAGLLLAACGGGGGVSWRDPNSVNFTFGAPSSSLTAAEQTASSGGAAALAGAPGLVGEADPTAADAAGSSLANLPNQMSALFSGSTGLPFARALRQAESAVTSQSVALLAAPQSLTSSTWDNPDCWTLTASGLRYASCRTTQVQNGVTVSLTLDGSITRAAGQVSWDVTATVAESQTGASVSASDHLKGTVTFSDVDQSIVGRSRSDIEIHVSAQGQSASGAATYSADYDLQYTTDPSFCITGGTLTAKRFWSELPAGADPALDQQFADAGVQFTWQGCGVVLVAYPVI
jgi:hypothetical protein